MDGKSSFQQRAKKLEEGDVFSLNDPSNVKQWEWLGFLGWKRVILIKLKVEWWLCGPDCADIIQFETYVLYETIHLCLWTMSQGGVHTVTHMKKIEFPFRPRKPPCKAGIMLAQERHKAFGFSEAQYVKKYARPQISSMFKVALNIIFLSCGWAAWSSR